MYAKIKQFTPRNAQETNYAWALELSHDKDFKGHVVKGMFETLQEVLDVVDREEHFIIEA